MNKTFLQLLRENIIIQGLVSLILVIGLVIIYVNGEEPPTEYVSIVMIVIGFYFGSKLGKSNQDKL